MGLGFSRQNLIGYLTAGIMRKLTGSEKSRGRILVVENSELGFDLGPLLARVLRIPYFDARLEGEIKPGRAVVSASTENYPSESLINLQGRLGEYLLEMTGGVDVRIEALKLSMQQLRNSRSTKN